ncbi:Ribonuclease H domain [Sesbania bispinosa]|nr:Ribonuclease H domain [Sesbania bispinosa]
MRIINSSPIGKLIWDLLQGKDKSWVKVLTEKYFADRNFLSASTGSGASYVWQSIIKTKDDLKEGYIFCLGNGFSSFRYSNWSGAGNLCNMVPYVHITDTDLSLRDLVSDNSWDFSRLYTCLPQQVLDLCISFSSVLNDHLHDGWIWRGSSNDIYSSREWMLSNLHGDEATLFLAALWWLWCWRNNACLGDKSWSIEFVLRSISLSHDEFLQILGPQRRSLIGLYCQSYWQPLPPGSSKLNVDGSHLPSSQRIGVGGILRDENKSWISGFSGFQGIGTVVEAKYLAILMGLEFAWNKGVKNLVIESDCLDVISELNLPSSLSSHPNYGLLCKIRSILNRDWVVTLQHVARDANRPTDCLAKFGSSYDDSFLEWVAPLPELATLVLQDEFCPTQLLLSFLCFVLISHS